MRALKEIKESWSSFSETKQCDMKLADKTRDGFCIELPRVGMGKKCHKINEENIHEGEMKTYLYQPTDLGCSVIRSLWE